MFAARVNPQLFDSNADRTHRAPIDRRQSVLEAAESIARQAPRIIRKPAYVLKRRADPLDGPLRHLESYKYVYGLARDPRVELESGRKSTSVLGWSGTIPCNEGLTVSIADASAACPERERGKPPL